MTAHVTSTDFLTGDEVGLYEAGPRPGPGAGALDTKKVPKSGQVVFDVAEPGVRYWLAGEVTGRWLAAQTFSKPGKPVDVRATLALTRPDETDQERVVGARGTANVRRRPRRR